MSLTSRSPVNSKLPWWTWVAPALVCHLGTLLSLRFQWSAGVAILYLPIPLAIMMVHWWGPRVLVGLYLNAVACAGLWGLPRWPLWPLYAFPETLAVGATWLFFVKLAHGQCWLPDRRSTILFILLAILPAALCDGFLVPGQLVLLGDLPAGQFWSAVGSEWVATFLSGVTVAIPGLIFGTAWLERRRLTQTAGATSFELIPPRASWAARFELGGIFLATFLLSRLLPEPGYWYVYAIMAWWGASRFGLGGAALINAWIVFLILVLPALFGRPWSAETSLINLYIGLGVLCASALLTGSTVTSLVDQLAARALAETVSRENAVRYRTLFEQSPDGIVILNPEIARPVEFNDQVCRQLGYTREEFARLTLADIEVVETIEESLAHIQKIMREGRDDFETRQRTKQGEIRDVHVTAQLIDAGGRPIYHCIWRDITERKRAEEARVESELKYRTVIERFMLGFALIDELGYIIEWNQAMAQISGVKRVEVIGQPFWDVQYQFLRLERRTAEVYEHLKVTILHALRTGLSSVFNKPIEVTIQTADGEQKVIQQTAFPIELRERRYIASVAQDITERKRVEQERERLTAQVQEQARQMKQILDTVPVGMLLLDAAWRVVEANSVADKDLAVLVGAQGGPTLTRLGDRPLAELLTSPPAKGLWHEVKAGERTFEAIARPLESGAAPEHWVLVLNDVTREREIQAQLQQQERLAAVGQLAAGIAHDFNNIMAVIVLYAQMGLRTKNIPPKLRERLEIVSQQANRATDLIQQILDFSRQTVLDRCVLDLHPFLKEMVKLFERTVPENIKIDLICANDEYIVNADPTRLQQAIMNLVVNARDAMPEGGALHIALSRVAEIEGARCVICGQTVAGEWVRLTVTDTGTGISPEALSHIFEPFFTTKEIGKGTGLGLPQVYGIVVGHEGHIDVTTQVGKGTTFTIYLPAVLTQRPEVARVTTEGLVYGHGETLLIVEDNATVRLALVDSLVLLNYQVLEATNGLEALDVLETHPNISLVLSDVVMPEMGGLALLRALREQGWQKPVILLTGHPMNKELESLREQDLAVWLPKPPDMEQLAQAVAEALC